jgi:N-acetylmuramoyl-L-alanine amidase
MRRYFASRIRFGLARAAGAAVLVAVFAAAAPPRKIRVLVDPGHGGKDAGAIGWKRTKEKDVNLRTALDLAKRLRETGLFDVRLTRTKDVFVTLPNRCRLANDWKADLFVSIHANYAHDRREKGAEVYFLSDHASDPEAARLAEVENAADAGPPDPSRDGEVAQSILGVMARTENLNRSSKLAATLALALKKKTTLSSRGVKQASLYVLHWTDAPAALVEMGFVSNRKDAARLRSASFRNKIAKALASGIVEYARSKEFVEQMRQGSMTAGTQ